MSKTLTQERLKELMHYDPDTGVFIWLVSRGSCKAGDVASSKSWNGYLVATVMGTSVYLHRLAFFYMTGEWPKDQGDHINNDRSDNRWENLREATAYDNQANRGVEITNKSGFKGVSRNTQAQTWKAKIGVNGEQIYLGCFYRGEDAARAYDKAALEHHGDFARTNEMLGLLPVEGISNE